MRLRYNLGAFEQIRRDPALDPLLESAASRIAQACGDGYAYDVGEGRTRSRAGVYTRTAEAMADNAANNTLLRNLS